MDARADLPEGTPRASWPSRSSAGVALGALIGLSLLVAGIGEAATVVVGVAVLLTLAVLVRLVLDDGGGLGGEQVPFGPHGSGG